VASTLQPPSTVHSFTFSLPQTTNPYGVSASGDPFRGSTFPDGMGGGGGGPSFLAADPFARPSSAMIGPPVMATSARSMPGSPITDSRPDPSSSAEEGTAYYGVCLTVWSHADAERTAAIRRALEGRARKGSVHSLRAARLNNLRAQAGAPSLPSPRRARARKQSDADMMGDTDAEGAETEMEGALTEYAESEYEGGSTSGHAAPGASTVFLPGDAVFWLPYALTLVSKFPIMDLMRDYLTLSWARFSKDVQSHTLQIAKILAHPAPRAGEFVHLDAGAPGDAPGAGLEVVARFPGGLDFGQGLIDANVTMWPLFKALNVDNILTICEIALAPTGRVLFHSRYPAMIGIAVSTIRYLLELRGWSGLALPAVHCRDARIFVEDPGPWLIGMAAEARYTVRPPPEVCVVDLDINYLSCPSPPPGVVSMKAQRDKLRTRLLSAFGERFHPDHCIPR
jgi:nicotinamide N-methyltransferase